VIPRLEGDANAREAIRTSLGESLVVEASAGTGKTTELVNRIVAVLRAGLAKIDQVVAVTFTHKAAGELKVRLRQELDNARRTASGDELEHLEQAIEHLEEAAIGTIHSFCAQVLRERPVEAKVDPAFAELAEQEQQRIFDRAFRSWFEWALAEDRPGVRRALTRLAWDTGAKSAPPSERLRWDGLRFVEWRDFKAPWRRETFDRIGELRALGEAVVQLAKASELATRDADELYKALRPVRDVRVWMRNVKHRKKVDYDAVEAVMLKLLKDLKRNKKKGRGRFSEQITREGVLSAREHLMTALERYKRSADAELAADLQADMQELLARYESLKQRAGKLDFVDLLVKVRDLVRDCPEVRAYLQRRFSHLFVDEFQDTDPVQAEIIVLLAAEDPNVADWRKASPAPGKLFIVGDPKQSIYKFRRADVLVYQEVRDHLTGHGARLVHLTESHRALRPIQQCVNAAFEPVMVESRSAGRAAYVPLDGHRDAFDGQPAVVVLPPPIPYYNKSIDECLPDATAAFIEWLLRESGWKVRAPGEDRIAPVEARHIAVLFRRRVNFGQDITRPYIRCLEARGIPHLLVGSKSFHQREEVETLRTACAAIEWPTDELSVYATLKGPLFAIPDSLLFRYRMDVGRLNPLRPEDNSGPEFEAVRQALEILAELHRNRNRRPAADTLNTLLEATRAHAGFAVRPGGHQVISNVHRFIDLARSYETGGGASFRGFHEAMQERAERADSNESPMVEESADGVRVMTVHTAKGLEFPVVILADMTAGLSQSPERYIDTEKNLCALRLSWCLPQDLVDHEQEEEAREQAEGVRVAYVAATRARDLLVIPASGEAEHPGWLSPLNRAIYPPGERRRKPTGAAPGCPQFKGDRTALPQRSLDDGAGSVRPGLHRSADGSYDVVWWDPSALRLGVDARLGLGNDDVLTGDAEAAGRAYEEWRTQRDRSTRRASLPSIEVANPTEMPEPPPGIEVEFLSTGTHEERPYGPRFGTLVHAILRATIGTGADPGQVAASLRRVTGCDDKEMESAIVAVRAALATPLLRQAARAPRCHRELPVSQRLDEQHFIEGNIDLAFEAGDGWHVVDYKTDEPTGSRRAQYERQVAWYGAALAKITGKRVRCYLLSV
jgi:ATP-dependent helicase/nuclease subunit A